MGDLLMVEHYFARVRLHHPGNQIKYGRFPGSVRTDQPDDLSAGPVKNSVL